MTFQIVDELLAQMAKRLLPRVRRHVVAERVERLRLDPECAAVAGGADHAGIYRGGRGSRDRVVDGVAELRDGRLTEFNGGYTDYLAAVQAGKRPIATGSWT